MFCDRQQYSVLIVSSSQKGTAYLQDVLSDAACFSVTAVQSAGEARRQLISCTYDIILVNTPLSDDNGEELALDAASHSSAGVILFVREMEYDPVTDRVLQSGVLTVSKPVHRQNVLQAAFLAAATRERMRSVENQNSSLRQKMDELRLVNRAKWLLIEREHMDEPQAHRYVEKLAMDLRITKGEAAESVLRNYE